MRDINPDPYGPTERSIRNIPLAHRRTPADEPAHHPRPPHHRRRARRLVLWFGIFVVLCATVAVVVSTVFAGVTVHLTPRSAQVRPTGTLNAQLNGPVG